MVRQKKLTETYTESKTVKSKLPVKRKLVGGDENNDGVGGAGAAAVGVPAMQVGLEDSFLMAKQALHTSRPGNLPGREEQIEEVRGWLEAHLTAKVPGAMYVSGAPGVGKTAVILHSVAACEESMGSQGQKKAPFSKLVVNCMSVSSPQKIYEDIANVLRVTSKAKGGESLKEKLHYKLTKGSKSANMLVLVLDEMDQLVDGKGNEVLYSLFEWARIAGSKLILLGIANALDLTVRHLPLLGNLMQSHDILGKTDSAEGKKRTKANKSPDVNSSIVKVINFPPYQKSDIESILEARLTEIGNRIFEPAAIKFVAAKVAASTGDMRKALNACKLALDTIEKQQREVLRSTADDGFNFSSPKKFCILQEKINVITVAKIFGPQKDDGPLPLQQLVILGTFLRLHKAAPNSKQPKADGVIGAIPLSNLYDEYRKICSEKGLSWMDRSEIVSVCGLLQDRSLVTVIENPTTATAKKLGMSSKNKTGFLFDPPAVEKLIAHSDMKSLVSA